MSDLPEATRQRVRQRADNRCEYCLSHQENEGGYGYISSMPTAKLSSTDTCFGSSRSYPH